MITIERFAEMVETPLKWADSKNCSKSFIMGIIERTMRLTLADPELAREYYYSRPMAIMDIIVTSKREDCEQNKKTPADGGKTI
jgi:hypothetical protein